MPRRPGDKDKYRSRYVEGWKGLPSLKIKCFLVSWLQRFKIFKNISCLWRRLLASSIFWKPKRIFMMFRCPSFPKTKNGLGYKSQKNGNVNFSSKVSKFQNVEFEHFKNIFWYFKNLGTRNFQNYRDLRLSALQKNNMF